LPFDDSRRLIGANLFFADTGAVLELAGLAADEELIAGWRRRVSLARASLGWRAADAVARVHPGGASLALPAPPDQLFTATEVNEWALCAALFSRDPQRWSQLESDMRQRALEEEPTPAIAPVLDETAALERLKQLAGMERRPDLTILLGAADEHGLMHVLDDDCLTLGAGVGGRSYPVTAPSGPAPLPPAHAIPWTALHDIPTALVTGSNGKTTSVRLLSACLQGQGWRCGYSSTDGLFVAGAQVDAGDYSGPAGARRILRDASLQAAVLETARGGILRRGIATSRAHVALVTNISPDHFGEYGIFDLDALADAKLSVGRVVTGDGLLILNADDALLQSKAGRLVQQFVRVPPLGWFALDADTPVLEQHRRRGGSTCGIRHGRLMAAHRGEEHDLGAVAAMPLSLGATVTYNMANLAGAALAALALGVAPATIAGVLARFGANPRDNFGRLMQFEVGGVLVLLDYAHNPEGLHGLLTVAERLRGSRGGGRLGLILGHAGNRQDEALRELAAVAARFRPALIVVKENERHLRGRAPGEVPQILYAALRDLGVAPGTLQLCMSELEATRSALAWAQPGDVVALPVHAAAAREEVVSFLEQQQA
jgi:cyanophycin synthetase